MGWSRGDGHHPSFSMLLHDGEGMRLQDEDEFLSKIYPETIYADGPLVNPGAVPEPRLAAVLERLRY